MLEALLFGVLSILVGLGFTFAGYSLFRVLFPIWGFLVGLWLGVSGSVAIFGSNGFIVTALGLLVGFVIGLIFAALANFVFRFAVVLFGASIGYMLGAGFWLIFGMQGNFITVLTGIIMAVVVAGLFISMKMPKWVLIITTALAGAMAVIGGVLVIFGVVPTAVASLGAFRMVVDNSFMLSLTWLVLAGIGMAAQYQASKQEELMQQLMLEDIMASTSVTTTAL